MEFQNSDITNFSFSENKSTDFNKASNEGASLWSENEVEGSIDENQINIQPRIVNVVSTCYLGTELNLNIIANKPLNVEYKPGRFPGLTIRIRNPKATGIIFSSGKMVCTGARTVDENKIATKKIAKIIKKLGYDIHLIDFRIRNIVSTFETGFRVSLRSITVNCRYLNIRYNQEVFPGLHCSLNNPRSKFTVFANGKVVMTGLKTEDEVNEAFESFYPILVENMLQEQW